MTTSNYAGAVYRLRPEDITANAYNASCKIFRNVNGTRFELHPFGYVSSPDLFLSVCWVDLDSDDDLDLVVSKFIGSYAQALMNQGYSPGLGDNVVVPDGSASGWQFPASAYVGSSSIAVCDYNHDPYPDLLITESCGDFRARILRNELCNGPYRTFSVTDLAEGTEWSGAAAADVDLNGQEDVILYPKVANAHPRLLLANGYGNSATLSDRGFVTGLRRGITGGIATADFTGDGRLDLYLGRKAVETVGGAARQVLFRNEAGNGGSAGHWLGVRLRSIGNSNGSEIGAKVIVAAGAQRWTKTVDGGSGRGGQDANQLVFGLGGITSCDSIRVEYPSGDVSTRTNVTAVDRYYEFTESNGLALAASVPGALNPTCTYELGPDVADFVFKWRTAGNKGDMKKDEVVVKNSNNYAANNACYVGIPAGQEHVLDWGHEDTEFKIYWDGAYWVHEVRWSALPCAPFCSHSFYVKSGVGTSFIQSSGWTAMIPTNFCAKNKDPEEVPEEP